MIHYVAQQALDSRGKGSYCSQSVLSLLQRAHNKGRKTEQRLREPLFSLSLFSAILEAGAGCPA